MKILLKAVSYWENDNLVTTMQEELKSIQDNNVWDLVDLPDNFKPAGYKRVFKTRRDSRGNIEQFKVRLVVKSFIRRIDFNYTLH